MDGTPEEKQAAAIIEELRKSQDEKGVCRSHVALTNALIWVIWHIEGGGTFFQLLFKHGPLGALAIAVFFLAWVLGKTHGVELPFSMVTK